MGIVSGLTLFHNQIKEEEYGGFTNRLDSKPFTVNELYPIFKTALAKDKEYRIKKLTKDALKLEEIVEGENQYEWDTFRISKVGENDVSIKCDYLNDILHFLLSYYVVLGHKVNIEWSGGMYPFYNPKTFSNCKKGHYHYACDMPCDELLTYIKDLMVNFKGYNNYWEFTIFHDNLRIELNNLCSDIYEGEDTPEKELFGVTINNLKQPLEIINKATSESNGNYFFQKLSDNQAIEVMNSLIEELIDSGTKSFLTAFNPKIQSYYKIKANIKNIDLKNVAELIKDSNAYVRRMRVKLSKEETDKGDIIVRGTYRQKNIGYSEVINNQDILEGHVYLGKIYSEKLFETIQKTIAQNFCPCYIGTEDYPITIYYKKDNDRVLIEEFYNSIDDDGWDEFKDYWLSGFIKV